MGYKDVRPIIKKFNQIAVDSRKELTLEYMAKLRNNDILESLNDKDYFNRILLKEQNRYKRHNSIYSIGIFKFIDVSNNIRKKEMETAINIAIEAVKKELRISDEVGINSDDSLIILFTNTEEKGAFKACEKIKEKLNENSFIGLSNLDIKYSVCQHRGTDPKLTVSHCEYLIRLQK